MKTGRGFGAKKKKPVQTSIGFHLLQDIKTNGFDLNMPYDPESHTEKFFLNDLQLLPVLKGQPA